MYSKINNQKIGRLVTVTGNLGRLILENYINVLQWGMAPDGKIQTKKTTPCSGKRERVCNARDQCNWIPAVFGSGKTISKGKCVKKEEEEEEDSDWDGVRPLTFTASAYTSVGKVHHSSQMTNLWAYVMEVVPSDRENPKFVSFKRLTTKLVEGKSDYGWNPTEINFSILKENDVVIDEDAYGGSTAPVWLVAPKKPGSKTWGLHVFKSGWGMVDWNRGFWDGEWHNEGGDMIHPLNGKLVEGLAFNH